MSHTVVEEHGTGTQQILEPPGFTRPVTYLGLKSDPLDRTGKGFKHA